MRLNFCGGRLSWKGWLAARYTFADLDDMVAFPESDAYKQAKEAVLANPHYDASREPHEFKGFFLPEV